MTCPRRQLLFFPVLFISPSSYSLYEITEQSKLFRCWSVIGILKTVICRYAEIDTKEFARLRIGDKRPARFGITRLLIWRYFRRDENIQFSVLHIGRFNFQIELGVSTPHDIRLPRMPYFGICCFSFHCRICITTMKKGMFSFMPSLEAVPRACLGYMREHAHSGRVLLRSKTEACVASTDSSTVEKCGTISSEASFSSSLDSVVVEGQSRELWSPCCQRREGRASSRPPRVQGPNLGHWKYCSAKALSCATKMNKGRHLWYH